MLKEVCTDVCMDESNVDKACGGTVLRCLGDKIDDITDEACKSELLYFQKMEVGPTCLFCAVSRATLSLFITHRGSLQACCPASPDAAGPLPCIDQLLRQPQVCQAVLCRA